MKFLKSVLMALTVFCVPAACHSGKSLDIDGNSPRTEKSYSLPAFKAIHASSGIKVVYRQSGGKQQVKVDAVREIMPYLVVKTSGDALVLAIDSRKTRSMRVKGTPVVVYVNTPRLDGLTATSGSRIEVGQSLRAAGDLALKTTSGGAISLTDVRADDVDATASSGGSLTIGRLKTDDLSVATTSGSAAKLGDVSCGEAELSATSGSSLTVGGKCRGEAKFTLSSGSAVKAADFVAAGVSATASSGASLKCHATGSLQATASSGGSVRYKGNPREVSVSKTGVKPL